MFFVVWDVKCLVELSVGLLLKLIDSVWCIFGEFSLVDVMCYICNSIIIYGICDWVCVFYGVVNYGW